MVTNKVVKGGIICALSVGSTTLAAQVKRQSNDSCTATSQWPGWANIKNAFIFGDSYTQTGFDYTLEQPSAANPLGNPVYPGWTSSNGPNWVDYLTLSYNASSALRTYNFGYGGATLDSDLIAPYTDTVLSIKDQVEGEFLPGYGTAENWAGGESVFAVWVGINDVGMSWWLSNRTAIWDAVFDEYAGLVGELTDSGARNLVFVNVPPIERSPQVALEQDDPEYAIAAVGEAVEEWNGRVSDLALGVKDAETNVWVYDVNSVFNQVLDSPAAFEATAGLGNVTEYCVDYENGTSEWDTLIESCGIPVNEYFWLNNLHPTYPMHDVVASELAKLLESGPNVC